MKWKSCYIVSITCARRAGLPVDLTIHHTGSIPAKAVAAANKNSPVNPNHSKIGASSHAPKPMPESKPI